MGGNDNNFILLKDISNSLRIAVLLVESTYTLAHILLLIAYVTKMRGATLGHLITDASIGAIHRMIQHIFAV